MPHTTLHVEEEGDTLVASSAAPLPSPADAALAHSPSSTAAAAASPAEPAASAPPPTRSFWHKLNPLNWQSITPVSLLLTYLCLTFAQALPTTAIGLILANDLRFEPDETNHYYAATFAAWTVRPVYAFISDQVPLFSYRRRPYFFICALVACACQASLSLFGHSKRNFLLLGVATQIALAWCEVVCDSLSVEWGNEVCMQLAHRLKQEEEAEKEHMMQQPATSDSTTADHGLREPLLHDAPIELPTALPSPSDAASEEQPYPSLSPSSSNVSTASSTASTASLPPPPSARCAQSLSLLLSSTPDRSHLTPILVKSRVQSECMSTRSGGSVLAGALSILLMVYLPPRTLLFWGSIAFVLGMFTLMVYNQEKKAGHGYFFLSQVGTEVEAKAGADKAAEAHMKTEPAPDLPRSASESSVAVSFYQEQPHQEESASLNTSQSMADFSSHQKKQLKQQAKAPLLSFAPVTSYVRVASEKEMKTATEEEEEGGATGSPKSASSDGEELVLGMERERWSFLWQKLRSLLQALRLLSRPVLFLFLYNVMPDSEDAYYTYLYSDYYEFMDWQYGLFKFISLTGTMIGCLVYQRLFASKPYSLKWIFLGTTLLHAAISCSQIVLATKSNDKIGIGNQAYIILISLIVSGFGILAQMPPIVLASHYAPKQFGLEASMFSLFAASAHLGSLVSTQITARITTALGISQGNWGNLWKLILISNLAPILPLVTMPWLLPETKKEEKKEEEREQPTTESEQSAPPLVMAQA